MKNPLQNCILQSPQERSQLSKKIPQLTKEIGNKSNGIREQRGLDTVKNALEEIRKRKKKQEKKKKKQDKKKGWGCYTSFVQPNQCSVRPSHTEILVLGSTSLAWVTNTTNHSPQNLIKG